MFHGEGGNPWDKNFVLSHLFSITCSLSKSPITRWFTNQHNTKETILPHQWFEKHRYQTPKACQNFDDVTAFHKID